MTSLEETVGRIRAHHRQARFAMKQQSKMDRSLEAFFRVNVSGFSTGDDEVSRAKASKAAIVAIEKARSDEADPFYEIVSANDAARKPFDRIRSTNERAMAKLAITLPGYALVAETRGFGEKGFAQIVGEAGDLGNYATVSKLWKRLGLAVMDGQRQGNPGKGATAEDWIAHGYSGERRSILWNIGQSLFKGQSTAEPGPYRVLYDARKAYEQERNERDGLGLTKAHLHNRAVRYIEKRLLKDLWQAWRRAEVCLSSVARVPAAEPYPPLGGEDAYVKVPQSHGCLASSEYPSQDGREAVVRVLASRPEIASREHPLKGGKEAADLLSSGHLGRASSELPASAGREALGAMPSGRCSRVSRKHPASAGEKAKAEALKSQTARAFSNNSPSASS